MDKIVEKIKYLLEKHDPSRDGCDWGKWRLFIANEIAETIHDLTRWHKVSEGLPEQDGYYRIYTRGREHHSWYEHKIWNGVHGQFVDVTHYQHITPPQE